MSAKLVPHSGQSRRTASGREYSFARALPQPAGTRHRRVEIAFRLADVHSLHYYGVMQASGRRNAQSYTRELATS
jgi:hypothetical protein